MKHNSSCRFCEILNGNYKYKDVDKPIAISDDFIAVSSIGAMVEGWILVIPKDHQCSMKELYLQPSLTKFINSVTKIMFQCYGALSIFEHGANREGSLTGCGVDHAHLHIVPLKESLYPEIEKSDFKWSSISTSNIATYVGEKEYLFYTHLTPEHDWNNPKGFLHILRHPKSQFFRKAIGNKIGKEKFFDYKSFPNIEISNNTRERLSIVSISS